MNECLQADQEAVCLGTEYDTTSPLQYECIPARMYLRSFFRRMRNYFFSACEIMERTGNISESYSNSKVYGTHYPDGTVGTFYCDPNHAIQKTDGTYETVRKM